MPTGIPTLLTVSLLLVMGCSAQSEFVPLFNGRDLAGWRNVDTAPSTFTVRDEEIVITGIPTGVMCTDRQYENFVLELDWKHVEEGGNGGVFVHSDGFPARGQPFTRAIECQIMDGNGGDVFAIQGATMVPDRPHPRGAMRSLPIENRVHPAGEWNHYRLESQGGVINLAVNGKVVSGGSETNPRKGYICLESEGSEVHFRSIRIRELPSTNPSPEVIATVYPGFTPLYRGIDLSGWQNGPDTPWLADNWILRNVGNSKAADAKGGRSESQTEHLWTEKKYGDFELVVDWKMNCESNADVKPRGGVFLRGHEDAEIFIGCPGATGGEKALVRAEMGESRTARGWSRLEISTRGDRVAVELDGTQIVDRRFPAGVPASGPIGLVDYGDPIEYANLMIKEIE